MITNELFTKTKLKLSKKKHLFIKEDKVNNIFLFGVFNISQFDLGKIGKGD